MATSRSVKEQLAELPVELLGDIALGEKIDRANIAAQLDKDSKDLAPVIEELLQGKVPQLEEEQQEPQQSAPAEPSTPKHAKPEESSGTEKSAAASAMNCTSKLRKPQQDQSESPSGASTSSAAASQPAGEASVDAKSSLEAQLEELLRNDEDELTVDPALHMAIPPHLFARYQFQADNSSNPSGLSAKRRVPDAADEGAAGSGEEAHEDVSQDRGTVFLQWSGDAFPASNTTLYRVVATNYEMETPNPDDGDQLIVTRGLVFEDDNLGHSALRHYQVWAYSAPGDNLKAALSTQPILVGESAVVFPPDNFRISEASGTVQGSWDALAEHEAMKVHVQPRSSNRPLSSAQCRLVEGVERHGFTHIVNDRDKGREIEFQVFGQARFRGNLVSDNVGTPVLTARPEAEVQQMSLDYCTTVGENLDEILLTWTAPSTGKTEIYLSDKAPAAELSRFAVEKPWIEDDPALSNSTKYDDESPSGEVVKKIFKWPSYHRVYITLVNVVGETAWASESAVLQRVAPIAETRLIERVDSQLITFDWPAGATLIRIKREGHDEMQLQREDYDRQGGVRLHLNPTGERNIELIPASSWKGEFTNAPQAQVLNYRGLRQYSYRVFYDNQQMYLQLWSVGHSDRNPPRFILRYHRDRLPLHANDGEVVRCVDLNQPSAEPQQILLPSELPRGDDQNGADGAYWGVEQKPQNGFYRLFVQEAAPADAEERQALESKPRRVVVESSHYDVGFTFQTGQEANHV